MDFPGSCNIVIPIHIAGTGNGQSSLCVQNPGQILTACATNGAATGTNAVFVVIVAILARIVSNPGDTIAKLVPGIFTPGGVALGIGCGCFDSVECLAADFGSVTCEGNFFDTGSFKRRSTDGTQTCREIDTGQLAGLIECVVADGRNTCGDGNRLQIGAESECVIANGGNVFVDDNGFDVASDIVPRCACAFKIGHGTGTGNGQEAGVLIKGPGQFSTAGTTDFICQNLTFAADEVDEIVAIFIYIGILMLITANGANMVGIALFGAGGRNYGCFVVVVAQIAVASVCSITTGTLAGLHCGGLAVAGGGDDPVSIVMAQCGDGLQGVDLAAVCQTILVVIYGSIIEGIVRFQTGGGTSCGSGNFDQEVLGGSARVTKYSGGTGNGFPLFFSAHIVEIGQGRTVIKHITITIAESFEGCGDDQVVHFDTILECVQIKCLQGRGQGYCGNLSAALKYKVGDVVDSGVDHHGSDLAAQITPGVVDTCKIGTTDGAGTVDRQGAGVCIEVPACIFATVTVIGFLPGKGTAVIGQLTIIGIGSQGIVYRSGDTGECIAGCIEAVKAAVFADVDGFQSGTFGEGIVGDGTGTGNADHVQTGTIGERTGSDAPGRIVGGKEKESQAGTFLESIVANAAKGLRENNVYQAGAVVESVAADIADVSLKDDLPQLCTTIECIAADITAGHIVHDLLDVVAILVPGDSTEAAIVRHGVAAGDGQNTVVIQSPGEPGTTQVVVTQILVGYTDGLPGQAVGTVSTQILGNPSVVFSQIATGDICSVECIGMEGGEIAQELSFLQRDSIEGIATHVGDALVYDNFFDIVAIACPGGGSYVNVAGGSIAVVIHLTGAGQHQGAVFVQRPGDGIATGTAGDGFALGVALPGQGTTVICHFGGSPAGASIRIHGSGSNALKGITVDAGNILLEVNLSQGRTILECIGVDGFNGCRDHNLGQTSTVVKCVVSDGGYRVGNRQTGQRCTILQEVVGDLRYASGNIDLG